MPWLEYTIPAQREAFIKRVETDTTPFSQVCADFGVSRKTGYKWLRRYRAFGEAGLNDRSHRPAKSPNHCSPEMEAVIVGLRQRYPRMGGRKINAFLKRHGYNDVPAPSTVSDILRRQGLIDPVEARKHKPFIRFEHAAPNDLWQMDFKGHFSLLRGRCHPLTVIDDHSRFCVGLVACPHERGSLVQEVLTNIFREYGLPNRMSMDNGSPWGRDGLHQVTTLTVWLMRIGIKITHSAPYHPQTQGKDERFHRSLKEELLTQIVLEDLQQAQQQFEIWKSFYNCQRPHEAISMQVPADRYRSSSRGFPEKLPEIVYDCGAIVRKVQRNGEIYFRNRTFRVSSALGSMPVELRSNGDNGLFDVYFCNQRVDTVHWDQPYE